MILAIPPREPMDVAFIWDSYERVYLGLLQNRFTDVGENNF